MKYFKEGIIFISVIFVFFCLFHFFTQRPLWLDEQAVYDSVKDYKLLQIFSPLRNAQVYPRGQLFFIKLIHDYVSSSVLVLRVWSLIAMLGSFLLWKKIYVEKFKNSWEAVFCLSFFAVSYQMSYYAAEFKPYAMDVLVVTSYLLFFQYQERFREEGVSKGLYFGSMLLPFLMFFSYASLFVFWIVIWNYMRMVGKNKLLRKPLAVSIFFSLLCLGGAYWLDLRHSMSSGIQGCWQDYFIGYSSLEVFFEPFGEGLREIITWWYGNSRFFIRLATPFIPMFFYAFGRYGIGQIKTVTKGIFTLESLFTVLFCELVILSIFKRYPFTGDRMTLFLAPFVFYFIVKAVFDIKQKWLFKCCLGFISIFLTLCVGNTFIVFYKMY